MGDHNRAATQLLQSSLSPAARRISWSALVGGCSRENTLAMYSLYNSSDLPIVKTNQRQVIGLQFSL